MELDCKALIGNLIRKKPCWNPAKLHQLVLSVQSNCKVMYSGDELSLTRSLFPEAMLVVAQNLLVLQKLHKMTKHYVFHDFTTTCQWNWSIVRSLAHVPLLEQKCHESSFPVIRNLTLFVGSSVLVWLERPSPSKSWWDLVRIISFVRFLAKKQVRHSIYLYIER